jgi:hypothetical protein
MSTMVVLSDAISHLRREPGDDDAEIQRKLDESEGWAMRVMGPNYVDTWNPTTVPGEVKSAILCRLTSLYDMNELYLKTAYALIEPWRQHTMA